MGLSIGISNSIISSSLARGASGGSAGVENFSAIKGYAPKMRFYVYNPSITTTNLLNSRLIFNPSSMIQVYSTQEIQSVVADIQLVSSGNVLIGLYKYDYPNVQFNKVAEWSGAIATGQVKYNLSSPVEISSGTYFVGITVSSGSATIRATTSTQVAPVFMQPTSLAGSTNGKINQMTYSFPSAPVSTLPSEIPQSSMSITAVSTNVVFPPNLIL